ncbi:efflux RND transporter periplasmic adaptor subunit [bacterium]|nr:efflux RND transporter periplasmic adaptor subunit [bacterium]
MAKLKKKKLFIFIGAVVILLIFIVGNLSKSGGKVTVQTETVIRGDLQESVSGSAKIQPEVQVKISAKVSGQIIELGVAEGDYVTKGQFLAQLDQEFYLSAVDQASSNLNYARAGYEKALNEYERSMKLFEDNLISSAELEIAKSTYEQSKAQVEQSEAGLNQYRDNLSKTTIYAPMDGTVSQLNKKVGEMAMGSEFTLDVIMVVADLNKMLAETEIDENDVVHVSVGDSSVITVDAFPDTTFRGIVKEIANTGTTIGAGTQEQVTNFLVKVSMLERPERLRPSMSATVDIITETCDDVLKIPIQCITMREPIESEGGATTGQEDSSESKKESSEDEEAQIEVVFVVRDGIAYQTPVKTGISSDTEWEILSGLEEGDEVVSGSYRVLSRQLQDGNPVKVDNSLKELSEEEE